MNSPAQSFSVACQNCGSPLKLTEDLRFVTCNYCASELEIVHSDSTIHSRVLKRIEAKVDDTANRLRIMELRLEIERLEAAWKAERESCMIRGKNGELSEPSSIGTYITTAVILVFGLALCFGALDNPGRNGHHAFFGVLVIGVAIYSLVHSQQKAAKLAAVDSRYDGLKHKLQVQLRQAQGDGAH